jgi:hypothetical protein
MAQASIFTFEFSHFPAPYPLSSLLPLNLGVWSQPKNLQGVLLDCKQSELASRF